MFVWKEYLRPVHKSPGDRGIMSKLGYVNAFDLCFELNIVALYYDLSRKDKSMISSHLSPLIFLNEREESYAFWYSDHDTTGCLAFVCTAVNFFHQ